MKIATPIYDKKVVAQMKAEDDFLNVLKHQERELERANEIAQEERRQKEEERRQKEEAKEKEKETRIKLAKKMLKYGEQLEDIILETGLSTADIQKIKEKHT